MSTFTYMGIELPGQIIASLSRYSTEHIETGGFLRAVLENNLNEAVCRADPQMFMLLPALVRYVYNELPGNIWGSKAAVEKHLAQRKKASA